ncbi:DUF1573 domain-containing protein [Candidatus Uhrbacteria bacterium]|nr:DUF1573 domain-containing protein [Candidatus Uhrbacteria bacterium]
MSQKKSLNVPIVLSILIGVVLVITIAITSQTPAPSAPIAVIPGQEPQLVVSETSVDLGTMKVSEERTKDITITNTGKGPLILSRVRTSCNCTLADITVNGVTTQGFNMEAHNPYALKQWTGTLAPGERATLKAIYRPFVMPVQGPVERIISFNTNDPKNPTAEITLRAFVE